MTKDELKEQLLAVPAIMCKRYRDFGSNEAACLKATELCVDGILTGQLLELTASGNVRESLKTFEVLTRFKDSINEGLEKLTHEGALDVYLPTDEMWDKVDRKVKDLLKDVTPQAKPHDDGWDKLLQP